MLLMALNVCWTAAKTNRNPGQDGHPWVFWGPVWPSELNKTGFGAGEGVQGAGREAQRLRREGTEPPGGWQWRETFSSIPQIALSHSQASLSLLHSEATCLCADVMAGGRARVQT